MYFEGGIWGLLYTHNETAKYCLDVDAHDCDGDEDEGDELQDIHICILYQTGDEFFGYQSVRSNRFYLIHDPKGSKLQYVEDYHDTLDKLSSQNLTPFKHMFAGYQYMEAQPKLEAKKRFKVIKDNWAKMKNENQNHTIHVELAHFNYHHTIHYVMKYLFNYTDSIGFNEQELFAVYNQLVFYKNRYEDSEDDEQEIGPSSSRLTHYDSLNLIYPLIKRFLVEKYPNISRVQYHTLGHMITWYDPEIWESGEESLLRTGLTSATYCALNSKNTDTPLWKTHSMNKLDLSQLSSNMTIIENFSVLNNTGDFMQFIKLEDTKFICGVTTTPTCIKPSKLTGLGDNISSTGFTYQNRIK